MDRWARIKRPEINSYICRKLIFNKGAKTVQWEGNSVFNKWYWASWIAAC